MRTSDFEILIVPGLGGSGEDHWQSRWEAKLKSARRVHQANWEKPDLAAWRDRVVAEVLAASRPVLIVAHSFGVLAVVAGAPQFAGKVVGAFLVTPPAERVVRDMAATMGVDPATVVVPRDPLPFPSVLVASRDDVHSTFAEAEDMAAAWGSAISDAGPSGHINSDSGHGPWPEGLLRFSSLLKTL